MVAPLLVAAALGAAVADWFAVAREAQRVEAVAKPAVPLLLATAALVGDLHPAGAQPWLVAGLLLSLVGDVLLLPRVGRFVGGLAAFLLAHVAYVPAFLHARQGWWPAAIGLVVLVVAVALVARRIVAGARSAGGRRLAGAVTVYIAAVTATGTAAAATARPLAVAGGALFLVSDALLGWDRFVARIRGGRVAVHASYHLAQSALVAALLMTA